MYNQQPIGLEEPGKEDYVWKLKKGLYGTMQGGVKWNIRYSRKIKSLGYERCTADRSLWVYKTDQGITFVLLYVDDYFVASNDPEEVERLEKELEEEFEVKKLENLGYFLGLQIIRDRSSGAIFLTQSAYLKSMLQKIDFENFNPVATPMDPKLQLKRLEDGADTTNAPY